MIEQLFGSKTRVKLLQLFLSNPNRSFYVREITRKIDEQINSVRRELSNLLSIGIIVSDNTNNRLYYEVNQKYQYYEPLAAIFGGRSQPAAFKKSTASEKPKPNSLARPADPMVDALRRAGKVNLVLLTGQFTRDEASGIDILIVGDISEKAVEKIVSDLEASEGKELRYAMFDDEEFGYRRTIKDRFVSNILSSKKQVLVDEGNLLS